MKTVNILIALTAMGLMIASEAKPEDKVLACVFFAIVIGFWVSLPKYQKSHKIN